MMITTRVPAEPSDTVNLVVALLVRFPEISGIRSHRTEGTVRLTYVLDVRLDREAQLATAESVNDHVRAFLDLSGAVPAKLETAFETDRALTFVHVTRDLASFSREELVMQIALLVERFGDRLVRNPSEEAPDDDLAAQDELVDYALESMRDPQLKKSLVGFREEKRVLVYFLTSRKKAKARARR